MRRKDDAGDILYGQLFDSALRDWKGLLTHLVIPSCSLIGLFGQITDIILPVTSRSPQTVGKTLLKMQQ